MAVFVNILAFSIAVLVHNSSAGSGCYDSKDREVVEGGGNVKNWIGSCSCGFKKDGGCFLNENKPSGFGCQCFLSGDVNCPFTVCYGRIVTCADPEKPSCKSEGKSEEDCLQGVEQEFGNCNGYTQNKGPGGTIATTDGPNPNAPTRTATETRPAASESCRRWCRDNNDQYFCCEKANEAKSPVDNKPGLCPESRSVCPVVRVGGPPARCSSDGGCVGTDKCCYDACLEHHTCKPAE